MRKILVILGPTSSGKTDLALNLAKKFNGELISCDSRQVYTGLDIGTGKLPSGSLKLETGSWKRRKGYWIIDGVSKARAGALKIWMYDAISPNKQYTVYDYVKEAQKAVKQISEDEKLPIIVGGTGLYLKALVDGLPNLGIPINISLRKQLEKLTVSQLQEKLKKISILRWNKLNQSDRGNSRRLIRAIELALSKEDQGVQGIRGLEKEFNILKIGLTSKKENLYERSDIRVIRRINQGMIEEAKILHKKGLSLKRMRQLGLEYGVLAEYLEGKIRDIQGDQGLIKIIQTKIHGYIRRQLTWFKKEKDIFWFDITDQDYSNKVEKLISAWYHKGTNAAENRHLS